MSRSTSASPPEPATLSQPSPLQFMLEDGSQTVTIRPIEPDDKQLLANGMLALSDRSIRQRFLSPRTSLTSQELVYLTEVDGSDHFALIATRADREDVPAAVARYIRLEDDPLTAEAAVLVADDLQGVGLGRALSKVLADTARENGITSFTATMQSDNIAAHKLMATINSRFKQRFQGNGVDELSVELGE